MSANDPAGLFDVGTARAFPRIFLFLMSKFFELKIVLVILFTIALQTAGAQSAAAASTGDYLPNTVILKVKPQYRNLCADKSIRQEQLDNILAALHVTSLHKLYPNEAAADGRLNSSGQKLVDLSLIYEINYAASYPVNKSIRQLLGTGLFVYAEPHYLPRPSYTPNDPFATPSGQYHLQKINAFNAWNTNRGDSAIVIGITDTGTDPGHYDLNGNIKRNLNDPPDMIDNDADGYVDNYMGWDLGMSDSDPTWEANPHGVHVCGIAGASADNNQGGAGVGFNCKLLPVKISDAGGNLVAAYEGIKYAADHGCAIINCSWGSFSGGQYGQDIVDYATINKGCLVVAASGNYSSSADFFPASYNGVLSVAATNASDVLWVGSDYGYSVDVCAPGESISSTWPTNAYTQLSGTSMASPCAAGAAGIVKSQFPAYNGLQVAERLRVTADNIYPQNPAYVNKLGKGRINLYRALTDPGSPSVIFSNKLVTDLHDNVFMSGDTLHISGDFTNYLDPTTALGATLTPLSGFASIIDNTTSLGAINTLSHTNNSADAFTFKLTGSIPLNQTIDFQLQLQDGSYTASQFFTVYLNTDYINITVNDVNTTATSRGNIGYNYTGQSQGLGFSYKGSSLVYEAGFMIGCDSVKVSDCIRGVNPNIADADFKTLNRIQQMIPAANSDFETDAVFNDSASSAPLNIQVHQNTYAWTNAPYSKFVIWEYAIENTHTADTLKNLYAGIFADWDVDDGTYAQNRSAYDAPTKTGYTYYTGTSGKYAGIKLLTGNALPHFYALDNINAGNGGVDITNGFTTKEKYQCLSQQRLSAGTGGSGNDVSNTMSAGPIMLVPGQSITVAFALLAGDSLQDLMNSASQAQMIYDGVPTAVMPASQNSGISIYPNPVHDLVYIDTGSNERFELKITDLNGKFLKSSSLNGPHTGLDISDLPEGLYIVKLQSNLQTVTQKIVKLK